MTSLLKTSVETPVKRERLVEIDSAKGLAIFLVVLGHVVMRESPAGNEWYDTLKATIYTFHMPFFMYISGFLLFRSGAAFTQPQQYGDFIKKRAYRFLVPFLLMGGIICFGKMIASTFIHVDNAGLGIWDGFKSLIWTTHTSPATSLWYIFVLFFYCLIAPPLQWLFKGRLIPLFILSIFIFVTPMPEYVYLDKIGRHFMFFMMGALSATYFDQYSKFLDRWKFVTIPAFALSLLLISVDMSGLIRIAIAGSLSILALHGLTRIESVKNARALLFLGKYSYVIYLFNTIAIGVTKGVMLRVMPWDGTNFLIFFPILLFAGIIGPILVKKLVFRHSKFIDNLTN